MPNWCDNQVTLKHADPAMIQKAVEAFDKQEFCQTFLPCPDELRDPETGTHGGPDAEALDAKRARMKEKYGYESWYDFCVSRWSTKWDVGGGDGFHNIVTPNEVQLSFESAWAPPVGVYARLEELGFEVLAYYFEPGCCFAGRYSNGDDACFDCGCLEDAKTLPADIEDAFGLCATYEEWEAEDVA